MQGWIRCGPGGTAPLSLLGGLGPPPGKLEIMGKLPYNSTSILCKQKPDVTYTA